MFQANSTSGHKHNLRHEGRMKRVVEAIRDVVIVLAHLTTWRASQNVPREMEELSILFMNFWTHTKGPCTLDRYERLPAEQAQF